MRTTDLIEAVRDQRAQVEAARQECSAKEVELARATADCEHLAADCVSALGEPISAVAGSVPPELTPEALQDAEEQHRVVSEKIERLGPVNVLARQEYDEVSQRQEFLQTQQQDLMDSIAHTRTTIKEIETASREQFDVAFNAINEQFRRVFTTLFDGGIGGDALHRSRQQGRVGNRHRRAAPGEAVAERRAAVGRGEIASP